jgi:hypothetical protein
MALGTGKSGTGKETMPNSEDAADRCRSQPEQRQERTMTFPEK